MIELARVGHQHLLGLSRPGDAVLKARDRRLVYLDRRRDLDLNDAPFLSRLATGAPQPGQERSRNLLGLGLHARSSI